MHSVGFTFFLLLMGRHDPQKQSKDKSNLEMHIMEDMVTMDEDKQQALYFYLQQQPRSNDQHCEQGAGQFPRIK
jgi:hypothetical protein